jgi:iron complex outermembrane receptor protein
VTELGAKQIAAAGVSASVVSLLRQAPSVFVYQEGIGDNAPQFTIRGLRGLEIATTLDGIPTQDLLAPGGFLTNNIGAVFTTGQISGVSIYPGVTYPDKSTFGTIGGTIAYDSKRPANDFYFDVTGTVGSFGTYSEGFELNSGSFDSPLGTGDNAAKVLLNYKNFQTQGFVDGTPSRENEMEFAFDKPYNDGLSKFQFTALYNTGGGIIENEAVPTPYLSKNGLFSNYPTNLDFGKQSNDFLTFIAKDDTYVNDYLSLGLTTFYLGNDQQLETYGALSIFNPSGPTNPLSAGLSTPFVNNPAGFGYGGRYGPPVGNPIGFYGAAREGLEGSGGYYYGRFNHYDPHKLYPVGSKDCPTAFANQYVNPYTGTPDPNYAPCGINDQTSASHSDTYGIQPRATIILPEIYGIANAIKVGGLFAKETSPTGTSWLGGEPGSPLDAAHQTNTPLGGTQRTIYQGYIQDKIDLLDNTLHLTPGGTAEGTFSSFEGGDVFRALTAPYYQAGGLAQGGTNTDRYGSYKATKWDRQYLPFFNVSYDFDKVLPPLKGLQVYGSVGNSALFAPVGDFGPSTSGPPPFASVVHLYEGGIKYNTDVLSINLDYFYQKVDRDFGFYSSQTGITAGQSVYSSVGQREFKGVEGSIVYQVTPAVQVFGNFSHLLAKYLTSGLALDTVAEEQYGVVRKGDPQTGIPDWISTFGVDYSKKSMVMDNDALNVRFAGTYTGHQYSTYDLQGFKASQGYPGVPGVDYSDPLSVFDTFTGATTTDPNGGISPFVVFNLDTSYTMPTPYMPILKKVTFDLNVQNLFDQHYFQYFYKQISPTNCSVTANNPTGNPYGCTPQFADAIPGQPFSVFFSVTARF